MKKIFIMHYLSLFISIFSLGQNYQTINSSRIAYFNNDVKCIRIDSVKYQKDSILYPFLNIQQLDFNCYTTYGSSWIGKKVIIKETGMNLFFNLFNDTIKLNTKASPGDKWICYQTRDSTKIEAKILSLELVKFLGIEDSVKTIGFQYYDKNMLPIESLINTMNIQISKNYGFIKTFNFNLFPGIRSLYSREEFSEYQLKGLSNPNIGLQNLTWLEVNDFQVGDELHIIDNLSGVRNESYYSYTIKSILTYLERIDNTNSVVYRYSIRRNVYYTDGANNSVSFTADTLSETVKPVVSFDKLPGEPIIDGTEAYTLFMYNGEFVSKTDNNFFTRLYFSRDSCWSEIIADGCLPSYTYYKGLGGPYYSCESNTDFTKESRTLVYYKKGDNEWGSPLVVSGISGIKAERSISVFPNPVKDYLNITCKYTLNKVYTLNIYDICGRFVKSENLGLNDSRIKISELEPGIYIYRFMENENIIKMDKFIVEP